MFLGSWITKGLLSVKPCIWALWFSCFYLCWPLIKQMELVWFEVQPFPLIYYLPASSPSTRGLITEDVRIMSQSSSCRGLRGLCLIHAILVILYLLLKGNGWYQKLPFKYHNSAHALRWKFPGHKTTCKKKCPLTKKCGCWIYSHGVGCCTGVVGTCSLHFWNI